MFEANIKRSKYFFNLLLTMHLSCVLALFGLHINCWLSSLTVIACLLNFYWCFPRYISLGHSKAILNLRLQVSGDWWIKRRNGAEEHVVLQADSLLTNFLIILNFKDEKKKRTSLVIFFDAVSKDSFRQLTVLLRHGSKV